MRTPELVGAITVSSTAFGVKVLSSVFSLASCLGLLYTGSVTPMSTIILE